MAEPESWLIQELERRGLTRRDFIGFCSVMASALALPRTAAARIAAEVQTTAKPILVWLEFQDCAGNTESFLRASRRTAAEVVLDTLSIDYHETVAGLAAGAPRATSARLVEVTP
jgi:hydrogenase small subunit